MEDFENLEKLRILAQTIAGDSSASDSGDEEVPVEVVDRGLPSDKWTSDGKVITVITGETAKAPAGNSGNNRIDFNALTEKVDGDADKDCEVLDECLFKGMNFRRSMKNSAAKLECDNGCKYIFDPGTVVKPVHGGLSIYIVKSNDGDAIMCAKPTNIESDMACGGTDGCWPQFSFCQTDLEPAGIDLDTLAALAAIVSHNDGIACSRGAKEEIDELCQEDGEDCVPDGFERLRQLMEDIYGPIPEDKLKQVNKFGIAVDATEPCESNGYRLDGPQGYFANYGK